MIFEFSCMGLHARPTTVVDSWQDRRRYSRPGCAGTSTGSAAEYIRAYQVPVILMQWTLDVKVPSLRLIHARMLPVLRITWREVEETKRGRPPISSRIRLRDLICLTAYPLPILSNFWGREQR
jgi:hypothetical protein